MNILFFLIPKQETAYVYTDYTVQQAIAAMDNYRYTAVPILDRDGKYFGTLTEGDLLRRLQDDLKRGHRTFEEAKLKELPRRWKYTPVRVDADIEDLVSCSMNQNFIPVIDDHGTFIGIVPRKAIIEYCYKHSTIGEKK